jgi:hypothetical protein
MTAIANIMALVSALSLSEKLELNAQLAASMAGGSVAAKTSSRKGKPAAPGTKAWSAFIEHAKATWPERFALPALPKDRMTIAKAIKDEDPEAYRVFCEKYVAEHPAAVAEVAEVAEAEEGAAAAAPVAAAAEKPKRVMSEEQKAKMKAGREAAKAAKEAAKAAGEPVPVKAAPAAKAKAAPAAKAAAAPAAKAAAAPAAVGGGGAAAAPAAEAAEDTGMQKITIGGDEYILLTANNNLYSVEDDGLGAYVGRYQPGDAEEIDFAAEESD